MHETKLSRGEIALMAAGAVAFVASILTWYTTSESVLGVTTVTQGTYNGWSFGPLEWYAILVPVYLAGRAGLAAADLTRQVSHLKLYAGLAAAGTLFVFLRLVTFRAADGLEGHIGPGVILMVLASITTTVVCVLSAKNKKRGATTDPEVSTETVSPV